MIQTPETDETDTSQEDILSSFREERMEQRKKRPAILIGVSIGVLIAAGVGCLTFGKYVSVYYGADSGDLPVIRADRSMDGMKPDTPGGMEVPNRDKLVYERLRQSDTELPVERLLPAAEKPVSPAPEQQPDAIAALVTDLTAQETPAPATAVVYEEDGTPVEVMFKETVVTVIPEPETNVAEQPKTAAKPAETPAEKPVEKAAAQPAEKTPRPATKPAQPAVSYAVQLVSARTEQAAESEWKRLSKKHKEIIASMPHAISKTVVTNGTFYRLRVGRFDKRDDAKALCDQLKKKKQECFVVK